MYISEDNLMESIYFDGLKFSNALLHFGGGRCHASLHFSIFPFRVLLLLLPPRTFSSPT